MKIAVVGSGNVAYALCKEIGSKGNFELVVVGRDAQKAKDFASEVGALSWSAIGSVEDADIYIVAVSDSAVLNVIEKIRLQVSSEKIICHTSGVVPITSDENVARFYPLQTFTKGISLNFCDIPIFIEANSSRVEKRLLLLSECVAKSGSLIDGETLSVIHLAATFANNFTNHLWFVAQTILASKGVGLEALHPLMKEGLRKAVECDGSVNSVQSGAAVRKDFSTIQKHLSMLDGDTKHIYKLLTENIIRNNE